MYSITRLNDVKNMLLPLISERKLSTQIVGSSSPEEGGLTARPEPAETSLTFHSGGDLQAKPEEWKQSLNIHPVILIQK